jgi:cytochrome b561
LATAAPTHRALYLVILLLLASGIAMSALSGLPDALFGTAELPALADLPPRAGHGIGACLLAALVVLHAGAVLYHHWGLRDCTLRRMWLGAR